MGSVSLADFNNADEKLDKKQVNKLQEFHSTELKQKDLTGQEKIVAKLFSAKNKFADLILGNLLTRQKPAQQSLLLGRDKNRRKAVAKHFDSRATRSASSSAKAREVCNIDSKGGVYTLKVFPKPVGYVRITLKAARSRQALCLDGTPAAYFLRRTASDNGKRWIIFVPGGAWCSSKETCFARSKTDLGSSKYTPSLAQMAGILSSNRSNNPYFYNWNVLYLQYCDGSSFMGDIEQPIAFGNVFLYSRGFTILNTFLEEIVPTYLSKAREVIVVGNSAGALSVMANADLISSYIPRSIKVHFVSDAGFFVDVPCRNEQYVFSRWMKSLNDFHNITRALPQDCVATFQREKWRCIMPENFLRFTKSSLALINSMADAWQLVNLKGARCGYTPLYCSRYELGLARQLRNHIKRSLDQITSRKNISLFLYSSCIRHCIIHLDDPWRVLRIGPVTLEDFVYRFVRGEKNLQLIEDPHDDLVCSL